MLEGYDGHESGQVDLAAQLLGGPSGLGTTGLRIPGFTGSPTLGPVPYVERDWGDGSHPPLYCPQTVRIDDDLGAEVNRRLVAWAEGVGIYADRIEE